MREKFLDFSIILEDFVRKVLDNLVGIQDLPVHFLQISKNDARQEKQDSHHEAKEEVEVDVENILIFDQYIVLRLRVKYDVIHDFVQIA